jgi:hypothetical protein
MVFALLESAFTILFRTCRNLTKIEAMKTPKDSLMESDFDMIRIGGRIEKAIVSHLQLPVLVPQLEKGNLQLAMIQQLHLDRWRPEDLATVKDIVHEFWEGDLTTFRQLYAEVRARVPRARGLRDDKLNLVINNRLNLSPRSGGSLSHWMKSTNLLIERKLVSTDPELYQAQTSRETCRLYRQLYQLLPLQDAQT